MREARPSVGEVRIVMKKFASLLLICGCVSTVERAPDVDRSMRLETASMMREALKINREYEEDLIRYLNFNRASVSDVLTEAWRRSRLRWRAYDARSNQQMAAIPMRVMLGDVHAREAMMVLQSVFEMSPVPMELVPSPLGVHVRVIGSFQIMSGTSRGTMSSESLKATLPCNSLHTGKSSPIIAPTCFKSGPAAMTNVRVDI